MVQMPVAEHEMDALHRGGSQVLTQAIQSGASIQDQHLLRGLR